MVQLALSARLVLLLASAASQLVLAQVHHGNSHSAPAPASPAVPLPANPEQSCALSVHRDASACGQANYPQYSGAAEDEACCTHAADFFGSSSSLPSRICYCDPAVLDRLMAVEELADLSSTDFFDSCGTIGIVVPYYTENRKGEATGTCAGYEARSADEGHSEHDDDGHNDAADEAAAPTRSFGQWFRQLSSNPYLAVCMAVAMPSVLGFLLFLWPFVFAAAASLHDLVRHSDMKGCPLASHIAR